MSKLFFKVISLFVLSVSFVNAQEITISGKSTIAENKQIWVYAYTDYFSMNEVLLVKQQVGENGDFSIKIKNTETKLLVLKTEKFYTTFFVEPEKNYELILNANDSNAIRTFGKEIYFSVTFAKADSTELNQKINAFEQQLDVFYNDNLLLFPTKKARPATKLFCEKIEKEYATNQVKNFFNNYVNYQLALLKEAAGYPKKELFLQYISPVIDYSNPAYVSFFNSFYKQYLAQKRVTDRGKYLDENINRMFSYPATMETMLAADTLLVNEELRELVLLKILYENYFDANMNKQSIEILLKYIADVGKNKQNKLIANQINYKLTHLKKGKKVPDFSLKDSKGEAFTLKDFKTKYVYINFYADWCVDCFSEMKAQQKLFEKYGKRIQFISFYVGDSEDLFKATLYPEFKWTFSYVEQKSELLNFFKVKALPLYVLLDTEADIFNYPARKPSEDTDAFFKELLKKK